MPIDSLLSRSTLTATTSNSQSKINSHTMRECRLLLHTPLGRRSPSENWYNHRWISQCAASFCWEALHRDQYVFSSFFVVFFHFFVNFECKKNRRANNGFGCQLFYSPKDITKYYCYYNFWICTYSPNHWFRKGARFQTSTNRNEQTNQIYWRWIKRGI